MGGTGIAANGMHFYVINAANGNHDGTTSTNGQTGFIQFGDGTLSGSVISQTLTFDGMYPYPLGSLLSPACIMAAITPLT